MRSAGNYSINDILREFDKMEARIDNSLRTSELPPAESDWFRAQGFKIAKRLLTNLVFGVEAGNLIENTHTGIVKHTDAVEVPTRPPHEEED